MILALHSSHFDGGSPVFLCREQPSLGQLGQWLSFYAYLRTPGSGYAKTLREYHGWLATPPCQSSHGAVYDETVYSYKGSR